MAPVLFPVLKVLDILRVIRIAKELAREHIKRFPGRGASILAFLGRRLKRWCHFWLENFGRPKPAERRFIGSEARSYSVLGGSATAGELEYVVAASYVPASASHPSLHEYKESPIRAPLDHPSRLRRATYPQFGCGLDLLQSSERATWPPTPTTRPHTGVTHHPSHLEIITTLPSTRDDGKVGPVVQPLAPSSYSHEPLSPPPMNELRRRRSSTSIVVNVQYPTTEPLPISSSTNPRSPTSSINPTLDYFLPEGRFVQLINSDQIPRYTKDAKMQVGYTIQSLQP